MKRCMRLLAMLIMLALMCPCALMEEEVVSEIVEPQYEEVEIGLGDPEPLEPEAEEVPAETEAPEAAVTDEAPVAEPMPENTEAVLELTEEGVPAPQETEAPVISEPVLSAEKAPADLLAQLPQSVTLGLKEKRRLPGPAGAVYASSKSRVVSVGADGTLEAKKKGSATVTVSTSDGQSRSVRVKVVAAPKKLSLSAKKLTLDVGAGHQLKAKFRKKQGGSVAFTSSNEGVARVDDSGKVTAIAPGSAVITARTYNGKKAKCSVKVIAPAARVDLSDEIHIGKSEKLNLAAKVVDANGAAYAGAIKVTVSPKGIAVYRKGTLTGKKVGTATLTIQAGKLSQRFRLAVGPANKGGNAERIPVLTYHMVLTDAEKSSPEYVDNRYSVSLSTFTQQMQWLHDLDYRAITCDQFYKWRMGQIELPRRSVLITFDDGYASTVENVIPVFERLGLRGVEFIIGSWSEASNGARFIAPSRIRQIQKTHPCMEFQSHTWALHRRDACKTEDYAAFVADARKQAQVYDFRYIAYPFGKNSKDMIRAYQDSGLKMAFLFGDSTNGYATRKQDVFKIKRIEVSSKMSLAKFRQWCD